MVKPVANKTRIKFGKLQKTPPTTRAGTGKIGMQVLHSSIINP